MNFFKKIILFSMFFVATRDIITAFLLTLLYIFVIDGLLHEKRKFCIVPNKYKNMNQGIDEKQYLDAKEKIIAYEQQHKKNDNLNTSSTDYDKYVAKLNILNK
jgi:hypothetical protein